MSLFGEDDELQGSKSSDAGMRSSSLFNDGPPSSVKPSSSLFDDGDAGESPWGMPTPRKTSRGDMIKSLLPEGDVPESYIDAYDTMLDAGKRNGQKVSIEGTRELLQSSGLASEEQSRLLKLVAPTGGAGGLGRSEFNVLLALVALLQEGSDEVTLDTVDERRRNLPNPVLPYLDKVKTTKVSETTAPPPSSQPAIPSTPTKPSQPRRDSLNTPEADPWASPAAKSRQTPKQTPKAAASIPERRAATMSRPVEPDENARTTSAFTTNTGTSPEDEDRKLISSGAQGGWASGYDNPNTPSFANGNNSLLESNAFGDPSDALTGSQSIGRLPASTGADEAIQITVLPEKEGMFMFQHRNYEVKSPRRGSSVVRRYSDFVWLLDCLHKRYPFRQLPLLPPKTLALNGRHLSSDIAFIEKRRRGLIRFLNSLVRHPILREEQLTAMFLTVPTEISVWRKQATISVQEEFAGKDLPPSLEDSLPTNLQETFDTVRQGVTRSADAYISLCALLERLSKRKRGVAADSLRFSQALRSASEDTAATYAADTNDVPLVNEGLRSTAKHLETSHGLLEDEARAWDEGVLEDLKRQRDCLVSVRDMFERKDRLARDNIPQLERRIEANEAKLQQILAKPQGTAKPGEAEKVEQAILNDKESIVQQHARGVFIKECVRDELLFFQQSQYHVSKLHQEWSQERVKYAELQADNWRSLSEDVENMPTAPS